MQPTPDLAKRIGKQIRNLVDGCEYRSQEELAKKIGIPTMVLNRTMRGVATPTADAIIKMAKYFGTTTDSILGLSPNGNGSHNGSKRKLKVVG